MVERAFVQDISSFPERNRANELRLKTLIEEARNLDIAISERYTEFTLREHTGEKKIVGSNTLQYDARLDWDAYELAYARPLVEHEKRLQQLDSYIQLQLKTHLGERLHVRLSTIDYSIKEDGGWYGKNCNTSMQQMIQNGLTERRKPENANPIDVPREEAEVVEFEKLTRLYDMPVGAMAFAISPPGGRNLSLPEGYQDSSYIHNFYDVFVVKERQKEGKIEKYIELQRYSSALTYEEYLFKLLELHPHYFDELTPEMPLDAYFLSHPVFLDELPDQQFALPEAFHEFMHKEHEITSSQDYENILQAVGITIDGLPKGLIEKYISILHTRPDKGLSDQALLQFNTEKRLNQHSTFNLILITADKVKEKLQQLKKDSSFSQQINEDLVLQIHTAVAQLAFADIRFLGKQENVQAVAGGCPGKSGMETNEKDLAALSKKSNFAGNIGAYGVEDFGAEEDNDGPLDFTCSKGHENRRVRYGWVDNCRICGEDVSCGRRK